MSIAPGLTANLGALQRSTRHIPRSPILSTIHLRDFLGNIEAIFENVGDPPGAVPMIPDTASNLQEA